ncbi:hypothetical protein G9A89_020501 [Geosiphon pyriformis]|nr:hypothetical protein G9A89_020501 [Geosiphon pyriformis]
MARQRKKRTHVRVDETANPTAPKLSKCFVIRSGPVGTAVTALVRDMRKVMEPNTASRLRERKKNRLKDFVSVAGQLGVTHFLIFTRTEYGTNLRIARSPRGPTLCFQVTKYSLIRDVLGLQATPKSPGAEYHTSPLLVLNNFGGDSKQMKLLTAMFQNMFPPINVKTMQLSEARRVVLFSYNNETNRIDFRHYNIGVKPVGISKSIKRIITAEIPDLHNYDDISEYVLREAQASESEAENGIDSKVTLPQDFVGRNNKKLDQRAIKLTELGPKLELQLIKVQSGLCDGEVLFHEFVHKTPEQTKEMQHERERRKQMLLSRRQQQEANVEKKKAEKNANRLATSRGSEKQNLVELESDDDITEHFPTEYEDESSDDYIPNMRDQYEDDRNNELDEEFSDIEYNINQSGYEKDNLFDEKLENQDSSESEVRTFSAGRIKKNSAALGKAKAIIKSITTRKTKMEKT